MRALSDKLVPTSLHVFLPQGRTIRFLNFANEHRSWGSY